MTPEQFKETRDRLGLTQGQLAYKIGLSERAVRYYEHGGRSIPVPIIRLMETFLKAAERA